MPQAGDNRQLQFIAPQFEQWVRGKLKDNVPMDQVVREMITVKTLFAGRGAESFRLEQTASPFAFRASQRVQAGERGRSREPAVHGREDRVRPVPQPPVCSL